MNKGLVHTAPDLTADAKIGDYFVERHWSRYRVDGPVSRLSEKLLYTKGYGTRILQSRRDSVVLVGDKVTCERLLEKLRSSLALNVQEKRASDERRLARDADLIEKSTP